MPKPSGSAKTSCPTGTRFTVGDGHVKCIASFSFGAAAHRRRCPPLPAAAQIEKGEQKIHRRLEIQEALDRKVASYKHPFQQLKIAYGGSRGKNFTEEEDRFMVCLEEERACTVPDVCLCSSCALTLCYCLCPPLL